MSQHDEWEADRLEAERVAREAPKSRLRLKLLLRCLGVALLAVGVLGANGGIYYSSVPHYEQMGWAIFCSLNAIWIAAVGVLTLVYAESYEVSMRQLNLDKQRAKTAA